MVLVEWFSQLQFRCLIYAAKLNILIYQGNKNVGERYKKWVQTFLKGVCPIESTLECLECQRNNTSEKFTCGDSCKKQDETYDYGIAQLAIRLYQLRNNVTHEGNLQGDHYLFDLALSDAEFPIQSNLLLMVNGHMERQSLIWAFS